MERLIIGLVAGAVGGIAAGMVWSRFSLSWIGDLVVGAVGGVVVSYLLGMIGISGALLPGIVDQAAGFGLNAVLMSAITGFVGGGVLLALVGAAKGRMAG